MKRSKLIYIIGSITLGVIALLCVLFSLIVSGAINATQTKLVFSSKSANFIYDGKVHQNHEWTLSDGTLKSGHTAKVTITGRQLDVGTSDNHISAVIVDSNGADVTIYYEIEYKVGKLKVAPRPISVTSGSKSKIYDGTPLTYTEEDEKFKISDGELAAGHRAEVTYTNSTTNAGKVSNGFAVHIFDAKGVEKTANYSLTLVLGILEVEKRPLVITSNSDTKTYDGTPLTNNGYSLDSSQLAEGHKEVVTITGSGVEADTFNNIFAVEVLDSNSQSVTPNYDITFNYGTLTIEKRELTIITEQAEKEYDGQPLTHDKYDIIGTLPENHTLAVTVIGTRTEIGDTPNSCTYTIVDENGNDVQKNYRVNETLGALSVKPRKVVLQSLSAKKIYDGTPLTKEGYLIIEGSFLEGHTPTLEMTGNQTDVGVSENTFVVSEILDADGNSVLSYYKITAATRQLAVYARKLTIESLSYEWIYDGEEHFYDRCITYPTPPKDEDTPIIPPTTETFVSPRQSTYAEEGVPIQTINGIIVGHVLTYSMPARITNVNENVANIVIEILIVDSEGADVTTNYEIEKVEGRLTIIPRPIALRAGSDSKPFDGTPLTCERTEIISGTLASTGGIRHNIQAQTSGSRTTVGEGTNKVVGYAIFDSGDNDVTANYYVTTADGTLLVYESTPPARDGNDLDESGSLGGNLGGGGGENANQVAVKIKSEHSGDVYLRYKSYGDYNKKGWTEAAVYDAEQSIDGYGANYMAGVALANAGYRSYKMSIDVNGSNYLLPYFLEWNVTSNGFATPQSSDTTYVGSTAYTYSCYYYSYDYVKEGNIFNSQLGAFSEFEEKYREFVYAKYLTIDQETADYMQNIISIKGFSKTDPQIIAKVASYIQNAAKYNLNYDGTLDEHDNVVVSFLRDFKEGVCRHYASSATLLFRQLGIPARYVIGYSGTTKADQEVTLTAKQAHAWVEVYLDGFGWVYVEVTGGGPGGGSNGSGGGNGGNNMKSPVIKPVNEYYKYDEQLHSHDGALQGLTGYIARGYTFRSTVEGTPRRTAGKSEYKIATFAAYYEGEDVTEQFIRENNIVFKTGILQVYKYEITVKTMGGTKVYDGKPLSNPEYICSAVQKGHVIASCVTLGTIENVGVILNTCDIRILDAQGNDITDEYRVIEDYGELEITPINITITALNDSKAYDGTPLTSNNFEITGTSVEGHIVDVKIVGSQTRIGSSPNKITSVTIYDATGVDVTTNYLIKTVNGTLTVTKPPRPTPIEN